MNSQLQRLSCIITICAGLATLVNIGYTTCDRIGCWKHRETSEITVECAPILAPHEVCPAPDSKKNSDIDVN
jgi:hypothetical protein